jgi:hypothetical protein
MKCLEICNSRCSRLSELADLAYVPFLVACVQAGHFGVYVPIRKLGQGLSSPRFILMDRPYVTCAFLSQELTIHRSILSKIGIP